MLVGCSKGVSSMAISALIFVFTIATADTFVFQFSEPSVLYPGSDSCPYYYDSVQLEPLSFNITASCDCQETFTLMVRKTYTFWPLESGCIDSTCTGTCSLRCTAGNSEGPTSESFSYDVVAETSDQSAFRADVICVRLQDRAWVNFVDKQAVNLTTDEQSRANLSFFADGYPQPLGYELSCTVHVPMQNLTFSSPTGNFTLIELPPGVTRCTAVAYTRSRLAVTEPLAVIIRVNPATTVITSTVSSATAGISTASAIPTANALPVMPQDSTKGLSDGALLAAVIVPCAVAIASIAATAVVGYRALHRRRHSPKGSSASSTDSSVPTTPCQLLPSDVESAYKPKLYANLDHTHVTPTTIINNSCVNNHYYGDTYEINGPGSSVVIFTDGPNRIHCMSTHGPCDILSDERSTTSISDYGRDAVSETCYQPSSSPMSSLATYSDFLPSVVELDNDETAIKHPVNWELPLT